MLWRTLKQKGGMRSVSDTAILTRAVREGLRNKVIFEGRSKGLREKAEWIWGRRILDREKRKCKCPEAGSCLGHGPRRAKLPVLLEQREQGEEQKEMLPERKWGLENKGSLLGCSMTKKGSLWKVLSRERT